MAGSRWAISFARYPASRSLVMSFSLTEEAIHLPCAPDPDMVECFLEAEKMRTWALELENGRADREKVWVKGGNPCLLIKAVNIKLLPTRLKTRLFPRVVQTARLDYPCPY